MIKNSGIIYVNKQLTKTKVSGKSKQVYILRKGRVRIAAYFIQNFCN